MKRILYIICIAMVAVGCAGKESVPAPDGEISFMAGVVTRVSAEDDCLWKEGDEIGVFTNQLDEHNMKFLISDAEQGTMTKHESVKDLYTLALGGRKYFAYHPYVSEQSTTTITIDRTTDQSEPLLWATKTTNDASVALRFEHKYAKVVFNLAAGGVEVSNLDGAEAVLKGANAAAEFDILSGEFSNYAVADMTLAVDDAGKITAYVVPTASVVDGVILWITIGENVFRKNISTPDWKGGSSYEYNITVGNQNND